jgi:aminopeptidase YwaD
MKYKNIIIALMFLWQPLLVAQTTLENLHRHERILASDSLEGRGTGEPGGVLAANYIANEFQSIGLTPLGDNGTYFQNFEVVKELTLGDKNILSAQRKKQQQQWNLHSDFIPLSFSSSAAVNASIVFIGFGISSSELKYDDYANIDVKGKIVLVLRYTPDGDAPHSPFAKYSALRYKVLQAREHGAAGVLVVTSAADEPEDKLIKLKYDYSFGDAGLPVVSITRQVANWLIADQHLTIDSLRSLVVAKKQPGSIELKGTSVTLSTELIQRKKNTANVIGIIKAPTSSIQEQVIVGAHYDHLGYGGEGSGSLEPDKHEIHNGADDNASGTSAIIEIARKLKAIQSTLKRDVVVIAYTGEELGTLGSLFYTKNPKLPLQQTAAVINLDMVGRLQNKALQVHGTGTSSNWEKLLTKENSDSTFILSFSKDGYGPSDHSSFYIQNIPVLFFFTGSHSDYHKPSDDYDKINYEGLNAVTNYVEHIALDIDTTAQRPDFIKVQSQAQQSSGSEGRSGYRMFVGTIPDFSENVNGMKISGVRDNSPAAKVGLQAGDVIIKFGKFTVKSLYDYSYALQEYKPGDQVEVIWQHGSETKTATITLEVRK